MIDLAPHADFRSAASAVLEYLYKLLGFKLCMVTRTEGNDWIILHALDHSYGVIDGDVFPWSDSFCSRMVAGIGPRIAPRSAEILAYREAPINRRIPTGAYVGMPLVRGDGSLFGTLCAIDPSPQPDQIANQQPTIELLARMLSTILEADLKAISEARCAERARFEALVDPLTELWNRRAWEQLMAAEEARCHRYGHPACVVSIDLDGFKKVNDTKGHLWGDELLRKTARALRAATRNHDVVARLGGDEFSVLAVECDDACSLLLLQRLEKALEAEKVKASLGLAHRNPSFGLEHSWHEADQAMYLTKKSRKKFLMKYL
ncbi:MAG TPA: sensor domain-containing diguanylate cyclase [Nitrospirales bacterium]|jgi:diguanylate cyclase (GGDEF)-like protein|nr:sensor domain-containing diguanylate cyclase [Nitrospirales bacterium]